MNETCKNHPYEKAVSFCFSCKEYFCSDCLDEGAEHYFCKKSACQGKMRNESAIHDDVERSLDTDNPKILIDGEAVGFCDTCLAETNPKSISKSLFSLRKAILVNEREPCDICGSVVMDLNKPLPIISFIRRNVGTYRIIKNYDLDPDALYLRRKNFISRAIGRIPEENIDSTDWFEVKEFIEGILNSNRNLLTDETFDEVKGYLDNDEYEMAFEYLFLKLMEIDAEPNIHDKERIIDIARNLHPDEKWIFDEHFIEKLFAFVETFEDI